MISLAHPAAGHTLVCAQSLRVSGTSRSTIARTSLLNPRLVLKCPRAITPNILLMELSDGMVELKIQKWRLRRDGMSLRPPPVEFQYTLRCC